MADSSAPTEQAAATPARPSVKPAADAAAAAPMRTSVKPESDAASATPMRASVKPEATAQPPATGSENQAAEVGPPRPSAASVNPQVAEVPATRAPAGIVVPPTETPAPRPSSVAVNVAEPPITTSPATQGNLVDEAAEAELQRLRAMPVRQYLETTVVPILLEGLQRLVLERPSDPVVFLVSFLSEHNPRKKSLKASVVLTPNAEVAQPVPPLADPVTATEVRASITSPVPTSAAAAAAVERASMMGGASVPPGAGTERKSTSALPGEQRTSVLAGNATSVAPQPTGSGDNTAAPTAPAAPMASRVSMNPGAAAPADAPVPPAS